MGVFANITKTITGEIDNLWEHSAQLITAVAPIFSLAFGVYVLLQCWHYYNKGFDESLMDITKRMLGWIIIIALAFNAGNYKTVAQTAFDLPEAVASAVSGGDKYSENAIDKGFENAKNKTKELYKKTDLISSTEMGKYLFSVFAVTFMWLCLLVFFVCVFAFYLVAKISLAAILVIGPLCLGSLLFPTTRQWGMSWINQIANYTLTISLYVVLGLIQLNYFDSIMKTTFDAFDEIEVLGGYLGDYVEGAAVVAAVMGALPVILISTIIFCIVALNVPNIAAAITGGATASTHMRDFATGAGVAGAVSRYVGNSRIGKAVGNSAKTAINKLLGRTPTITGT